MSSRMNHRKRSRATYKERMMAARRFCNANHPKARASGRDLHGTPDK